VLPFQFLHGIPIVLHVSYCKFAFKSGFLAEIVLLAGAKVFVGSCFSPSLLAIAAKTAAHNMHDVILAIFEHLLHKCEQLTIFSRSWVNLFKTASAMWTKGSSTMMRI